VVFDLDDTLYSEIEFVFSGIKFVINKFNLVDSRRSAEFYASQDNWIKYILIENDLEVSTDMVKNILETYRTHVPDISLKEGVIETLEMMCQKGVRLGLITDGRSVSQRNKIKALGILDYIDNIIISEEIGSEKPSRQNYSSFHSASTCYYVGDNPSKDFVTPNSLGWTTVMLKDDGNNIHDQSINFGNTFKAKYSIDSLHQLLPN